jgi:signal transduction histidine kinase
MMDSDAGLRLLGWGGLLLFPTFTVQALNSAKVVRTSLLLSLEKDELLKANDIARRAAVKANADKSLFLASASHDLRQPVHAQALFLEVLSETPLENFQKDLLANARLAASASSELLDALLDFSRLEAGVVTPVLRPFYVQDIFQKLENELAPMAEAKNLVYRCRETLETCYSDSTLIELILRNLTSNAIRYTLKGGVLVGARQRSGWLVVEVWDTGVGIEPEQHEAIFQEFHQLNNPARDRRKGLGLGLAIAKGLADRLGHSLTLRSRPGRGSVFRLVIPVFSGVMDSVMPSVASEMSLVGRKALVLDDDPLALQSMGSLLQSWGMVCQLVSALDLAIDMSKQYRPDIVVTDYRLAESRTGAQAIDLIRLALGHQITTLMRPFCPLPPDRTWLRFQTV